LGAGFRVGARCLGSTGEAMNAKLVEEIAKAVLYEGYILYPYRRSAVKNRQRFSFGVLSPREYCEANPAGENSSFQVECLARENVNSILNVKLRFLRLVERTVGKVSPPLSQLPEYGSPEFSPAQSLTLNGRTYESWEEVADCEIEVQANMQDLLVSGQNSKFALLAATDCESLRDENSAIAGVIIRNQEEVSGEISLSAQMAVEGIIKLSIRASNTTSMRVSNYGERDFKRGFNRNDALRQSLLSAHAILNIPGGEFISSIDPPLEFQEAARACQNQVVWPVLIGEEGGRDAILASPIILYDYPQIAPESAGELFDGTEIDEILALRILTLTDEEKQEMRCGDDRARQILERTESLPPEHMMKLHGVLRGIRPATDEAE
jgi:hypothetical protein